VQAWRRQALFALSNSTQVLLEPQLSLAWRPDHGTGGRIQLPFLVQCFTLAGTNKKRGIFGSGNAQTAALPGGIARICNTARAEKTLFYVPDSVKRCTIDPARFIPEIRYRSSWAFRRASTNSARAGFTNNSRRINRFKLTNGYKKASE
jgi:hypothetical protein